MQLIPWAADFKLFYFFFTLADFLTAFHPYKVERGNWKVETV
jgi:hypothetical protein